MTITDAAERVLFGNTIEEKLTVAPLDLKDISRGKARKSPHEPTRPTELRLSEAGVRASFPGVNVLDQDRPRGELLHFLANHELLASELMALVLLKFPEAPDEYRKGVYEAMREEQMHTLMYMRRMKECGVELGQLPLNSYFWRLVSPMKSPLEFVTKLNLTFEQANLDFSYHYAQKFREVGDTSTAAVLEKIYQDEIGHVGHGIKWLREWKSPHHSDWEAYSSGLELPFSASKAKGLAPYNPEGRRAAGLNEEFITNLSVYSQSRGRNPVLHWFNPNAETHALAEKRGTPYHTSDRVKQIEADLELLMIALTKKDDMLALRVMPSTAHLQSLRTRGIELPELVMVKDPGLSKRKLGGLIPWAWAPDASKELIRFKDQVPTSVPAQWSKPLLPELFSKRLAHTLSEKLDLQVHSHYHHLPEQHHAEDVTAKLTHEIVKSASQKRLKPPFSCSGRGHFIYTPKQTTKDQLERFILRTLRTQAGIVIEPEQKRVADFSVHYDIDHNKKTARFKGICIMENTPQGQFMSAHVSAKWTSLLPLELTSYLFKETDFKALYYERIPSTLPALLTDYHGPVGIDAYLYLNEKEELKLRPIVELNVRHTMGRVALELLRKRNDSKGALSILPQSQSPPDNSFPLNDPSKATTLQAYWTS